MRQKSGPGKQPAEDAIKAIRRATRRHFSAEDKIRIVLEGLRGEDSIAELCRREGIVQNLYYRWSKDFLEAGKKKRLAGDTARAATAIRLILDNHSAHISRETRAWLADQPAHRFEFTFTPKHGSWLNLIEGFFSKLARSVLRHIRVASKQELKERLLAAMDHFNQHPVVHTWTYKLDKAA
jgi:transposase-like protein